MSDEKPKPLQDVRRGLGLLLRAAKSAVERLPTRGVEGVVATSAREVGRAIENVASTIERGVFGSNVLGGRKNAPAPSPAPKADAAPVEPKGDGPKPPDAA